LECKEALFDVQTRLLLKSVKFCLIFGAIPSRPQNRYASR
jgi:hypothetical protein